MAFVLRSAPASPGRGRTPPASPVPERRSARLACGAETARAFSSGRVLESPTATRWTPLYPPSFAETARREAAPLPELLPGGHAKLEPPGWPSMKRPDVPTCVAALAIAPRASATPCPYAGHTGTTPGSLSQPRSPRRAEFVRAYASASRSGECSRTLVPGSIPCRQWKVSFGGFQAAPPGLAGA